MSNYIPTITVQYRDYAAARKERERTGARRLKAAPLITEVRPNPLSMELRIVLAYFWEGFKRVEARIAEFRAAAVPVIPDLKVERSGYLEDARNLCHELFAVTSPHAPIHIHSEHGCNDETCPAWVRGQQAAKDDVADWYTPDC